MTRLLIVLALVAVVAVVAALRSRRLGSLQSDDGAGLPRVPAELVGPGRTWLVFATRYCATCEPAAEQLRLAHPDDTVAKVLVEEHAELAERFAIRTAPTLLEVGADGVVRRVVAGAEAVLAVAGEGRISVHD